jgi:hypothetical protein
MLPSIISTRMGRRTHWLISIAGLMMIACSRPSSTAPLSAPFTARGPSQLYVQALFKGDWATVKPRLYEDELKALGWTEAEAQSFYEGQLKPRLANFTVVGYADRNRGEGCLAAIRTPSGQVIEREFSLAPEPRRVRGVIRTWIEALWQIEYADRTGKALSAAAEKEALKDGARRDSAAFQAAGLEGLYDGSKPSRLVAWKELAP